MFLSHFTLLPLTMMGIVGIAQAGWQDEILGQRTIKSYYGTYLHGDVTNKYVDLKDGPPTPEQSYYKELQWYIQERDGKAILIVNPPVYTYWVSASHFNTLKLVRPADDWEKWTPVKNANGTWSFQSVHGTWMSAKADKSAWQQPASSTVPGNEEQFVLEVFQ